MTVVQAQIMRPDATGVLKPARGYLRWTPVGRWSAPGTALVLPLPFRVKLVAGAGSVDVQPTTADWAWEVAFELLGLPHEKKVYSVPDAPSIQLSALTEVSPVTGVAVPPPPANWQAAIDAALGTALADAVGAALEDTLDAALEDALGTALDTAVAAALEAALGPAVDTAVTAAVASAVTPAVTAAVGPAVDTAVDAALADALGPAIDTAVSAALANRPATVSVVTGSEARPSTTAPVTWIGGATQPVNMADGDLWFKAVP